MNMRERRLPSDRDGGEAEVPHGWLGVVSNSQGIGLDLETHYFYFARQ